MAPAAAAALLLGAWCCIAQELTGPGFIRSLQVQPPGCQLDPPAFTPDVHFYVVECPQAAESVSLALASTFELLDAEGRPVPRPLRLALDEGEARLVAVRACGPGGGQLCTTYEFDVHRQGSSQAALAELFVSCGSLDLDLEPAFDPAVTDYEARVPNGVEVVLVAEASKQGSVSFSSYGAASGRRAESYLTMTSEEKTRTVSIFVVSADRRGQTRYRVVLRQLPSTDAALAAIRSNVGRVSKLGGDGSDEFMLTVPAGSREVAVSATARDRDGALVKVQDSSGIGYASAVVPLRDGSPYELVHIDVRAADHATTAEYILVVLRQSMTSIAMLSSIVGKGCVGGLRPAFRVSVYRYRCILDQAAEAFEVVPTVLWTPLGQHRMTMKVQNETWTSGSAWRERLDEDGDARVVVDVVSSDGKARAEYSVEADGYPESMRGSLQPSPRPTPAPPAPSYEPAQPVTTTSPSPRVTLRPGTTVRTTTTSWYPAFEPGVTLTFFTTTATTTFPLPMPRRPAFGPTGTKKPLWKVLKEKAPKLSEDTVDRLYLSLDVAVVGACSLVLLSCRSLAGGLSLLKQLQFLAVTMSVVAPGTFYGHLMVPLGVFNMWLPVTGVAVRPARSLPQGAAAHVGRRLVAGLQGAVAAAGGAAPRHAERYAGCVVCFVVAFPLLLVGLLSGWYFATAAERLARQNVLREVGQLGLRANVLSCMLVLLDICVLGFTHAAAGLLLGPPVEVEVGGYYISCEVLWFFLLLYPVGYSTFCIFQLCRLRREARLVWSPLLQHFVDRQALAATLHSPSFSALAEAEEDSAALGWLFGRSLQNIIPLQDPLGGPLQLGDLPGLRPNLPDGRLFQEEIVAARLDDDVMLAGGSEAETGLLPSKAPRLAEWQRHQERLGLLLWVERCCTTYEALRRQIAEAGRSEAIRDAQGLPIFDARGECLVDLYQYCIYQFPSRPWRQPRERWRSCVAYERGAEHEPVDRDGGVLAPWVPPASRITAGERQQLDVWLDHWLREAEAVDRVREMLLQVKWRGFDPKAQEDQAALLQELALAVLLGRPLQEQRELGAEELAERELQLAELALERRRRGLPPPWQADVEKLARHETLATLHVDLINSDDFRFTQESLQDPSLFGSVFAVKRFHLRTAHEDPATEDGAAGRAAQTRVTLVSCELPSRHLGLFAGWLPPFGVCLPHEALSLPVLRYWQPLFASCAAAGAPPGMYLVDALDRSVGVVALLLAQLLSSKGFLVPALATLAAWRGCWLVLLHISGGAVHQPGARLLALLEVLLCIVLGSCQLLPGLQAGALDELCSCGVLLVLLRMTWRSCKTVILASLAPAGARPFQVFGARRSAAAPAPAFGRFTAVDAAPSGGPLPLTVAVPALGLALRGRAARERVATSDSRRAAGCRKRLAVYERPPQPLGFRSSRPATSLLQLPRFQAEVRDCLPLVLSREQLVGTEEVRELVCTIHVVNHVGCSWSGARHDSYLSLYKPWGLDNQSTVAATGGRDNASLTTETERRERYRQSPDSPALVKGWRDEVLDWLYGELAASSSVEHTAQDMLLDAGRPDRDPFRTEADRRVVPGIFSDEGLGAFRHSDSRCFKEGRVLHYVILSSELKSSLTWRPDPLAAQPAELLCGERWRPCLLALQSRSLRYSLRRRDGADCGGSFPPWEEPVSRDNGDIVEYNVPFFFLERISVDLDQGLVTLHERDRFTLMGSTTDPDYAPRCLPIVFRVDVQTAHIWDSMTKQYRMSKRPEHIVNYVGEVVEHPLLPGIVCREGPEGEQLWDDGCRYVGEWKGHVYHGQGQLLDQSGRLIYKGEWEGGLKHGEGTYYFQQGGVKRAYNGQWQRDEFRGRGELWVLDESVDELRAERPFTILRYEGHFSVAEAQVPRPPNLLRLELEKHASVIKAFFPTRPAPARTAASAGSGPGDNPALQFGGEAPRDYAKEFYSLDGADLRHCGPSEVCDITYADGSIYEGPCLAGAVPHGAGGLLVEPNGTRYEGGFDHGLRAGRGRLTLANGASYEGEFAQPGGQRHGEGRTQLPAEGPLQSELGFCWHQGRYAKGLREGEGEMGFLDDSVYRGQFRGHRRDGRGCLREANGSQYDGPWEADSPGTGQGEILYSSGHRYVGAVSNCLRHGEGKLFRPRAAAGDIWEVLSSGQWHKDQLHGKGELRAVDGTYRGQFYSGLRNGTGKFSYSRPEPGSALAVPPSAAQRGEAARARVYEGEWEDDQPHGTGTYVDEYGYKNENALFASGRISSDRRPPLRGCKDKWFNNPRWPAEDKFAPISVEAMPTDWPSGRDLCRSRGLLQPAEPPSMRGLDVGHGHAHGRTRPAHLGLAAQPGTRWA